MVRSKSSPGVRMVTDTDVPPTRISSGSSTATVSGRERDTTPSGVTSSRIAGVRCVTLPTPAHYADGVRGARATSRRRARRPGVPPTRLEP
jgi:hypothetical protein